MSSRRNFLIICGALAGMAGWRALSPHVASAFEGDFKFSPIDGVPGYRKIDDGRITAASVDPFFNLGDDNRIEAAPLQGTVDEALHFQGGAALPVAEFTDYNCPYCKVLSKHLDELADEGAISLSIHHLPLLGPGSVEASKIVLAASLQAPHDRLHRRIMGTGFRVDGAFALAMASELNYEIDGLKPELGEPHIARAKTLARMFGIIGTPALIVGKTLVIGEISKPRLLRLIEEERSST